jgi:hypothetical protein
MNEETRVGMYNNPEREAEMQRQIRQAAIDHQHAQNDREAPRPQAGTARPLQYLVRILIVGLIALAIIGIYVLTHR